MQAAMRGNVLVKKVNQFTGIAFQMGRGRSCRCGRGFLAVGAEVFQENVAKGDLADALVVEEAEDSSMRDS